MANNSEIKREKMIAYINSLRDIHSDDDSFRVLNEIENVLNEKKYGLVWEEHSERIDEMLNYNFPVFSEVENRKINYNKDLPYNFLIEGDNLHSLKLLEKTHRSRIDVIYIDPPYNTGNNDFIYDDNYVDLSDGFRHSKWLSFMNKRLGIAYKLLADDGFIAISIDENEIGPLRMLCDEIFGEKNLLSTQHVQVRYESKSLNEKNEWQPLMEYILIYAKNRSLFKANLSFQDYDIEKFKFEFIELSGGETIELGGKKVVVFKNEEWKQKKHKDGQIGLLKETWASGSVLTGNTSGKFFDQHLSKRKTVDGLKCLYKVYGIGEDGLGYRYFTGPKKEDTIRGKFYSGVPLNRVEELRSKKGSKKYKPIVNYLNYSAEFGNIRHEGGVPFNKGKKPVKLIKEIINYHKGKNITILDFFAGSGTTGQAVQQLNIEDGGNRKYILCTNNENNICEHVTFKRLRNIQKTIPHNLKYYKTAFIEKFANEDEMISEKMTKYIKELVELDNAIEVDGINTVLLFSEEDLIIWMENPIQNAKLYISSDLLLTNRQKSIIDKYEITIIEIPEYYFKNELKEVGEL